MSNPSSLENGRAKFAYDCAEEGKSISKADIQIKYKNYLDITNPINKKTRDEKYKSYVGKLPMMIKTNGIGATFAFVSSKRQKDPKKPNNAYDLIYNQVEDWLNKDPKKIASIKPNEDLCKYLTRIESIEYRAVTIEVLALFNWLRRFADGLIEGND